MSKAGYAALMGLGEGLAQYGGWRAQDALLQQREDRVFSRQKSLEEIRQRYREAEIASQRTYNESIRDEERQYGLKQLTPGTPEYDLREQQRQKERTESRTDAEALIEARGDAYGYGSRGGGKVLSALNPASFTTESWTPFIKEFNALVEAGTDEKDAVRKAMEVAPLQLKPSSSAGVDQAAVRSANEAMSVAMEESPEYLREMLLEAGYSEQQLAGLSKFELLQLYRAAMMQLFGTASPGGGGLMGGQPPMGLDDNADPLGLFD